MSDTVFRANQSFLNIYNEIDKEISAVSLNVENLLDEELTEQRFISLTRHFDHIQGLFDRVSVVNKDLTLDQSNPDLYRILELKADLNKKYGELRRIRTGLSQRYEQLHDKGSEYDPESERERVLQTGQQEDIETSSGDQPEEIPEEPEEDAFIIPPEEEEKPPQKKRQQSRTDERQQYGTPYDSNRVFAEEERRYEQLRQEDERRRAEWAAAERRAQESAALAQEQVRSQTYEAQQLETPVYSDRTFDEAERLREQSRREEELRRAEWAAADRRVQEDAAFAEERARSRREEAQRLGMPVSSDKEFSEAELRNERFRQEEERRHEAQAVADRRARQDATFAEYQERMDRSARFEGLNKSHNDYSPNLREGSSSTIPSPYGAPPVGFSPTGTVPLFTDSFSQITPSITSSDSVTPDTNPTYFNSYIPPKTDTSFSGSPGNQEILSFLSKGESYAESQTGTARQVSYAFDQQMRFNVESARMDYHAARGTPEEKAAAHRYLQERSAYADFRRGVKENRYEIQDITPPAPEEVRQSVKAPSSVSSMAPFLSFTPSGVEGAGITNGALNQTSLIYNNPGLMVNTQYTADSPLSVSPEYEAKILERMQNATAVMNTYVANGTPAAAASLPHAVSSELKLATEAYLGYQSAKAAGSVVVSSDKNPDAVHTPDFRMWQQQYAAKTSTINISEALGSTGQHRGMNLNKVTKSGVEEVAASITGKEHALKRQSVAGTYFSIAGQKFQNYTHIASRELGRKLYRLIQDGDDNALSTLETGRYYMATGYHVGVAIKNVHPVMSTADSAAKLAKWEFARFGNLTSITDGALKTQISDHRKTAMALKKEIKSLIEKGAALTDAERETLSQLRKQHRRISSELGKEMSYAKYRQKHAATLQAAKDLKAKHPGIVTIKDVDNEIKKVQKVMQKDLGKKFDLKSLLKTRDGKELRKLLGSEEMMKKFGGLTRVTNRSLARKISELEKNNPLLKERIKLLQAKGSALTTAERQQLKQLLDKHKEDSFMLRKLKGLLKARGEWDEQLGALSRLRQQMSENKNAWSSGFYALQNLMLKPIFEGSELGAMGLAKGIRFATNPYVIKLMKLSMKASMFMGKMAIEAVAPGTVQALAIHNAYIKSIVDAKISSAQHLLNSAADKTSAAVKASIKNAAKKYTPPKIKTAVNKGTAAVQNAKRSVRDAIAAAKKWFADTKLGKGLAAIRRTSSNIAAAFSKGLGAVKVFAVKGAAIFLAVYLSVGIISAIATSVSSIIATQTTIMSPYTTDDGKISLKPYLAILEVKQAEWDGKINALASSDSYENVVIKYGTSALYNHQEILCMMAVKMDQDLILEATIDESDFDKNFDGIVDEEFDKDYDGEIDEEFLPKVNERIKPYLEHLFDVSHSYSASESYWECEGCKTRIVIDVVFCGREDDLCDLVPNSLCYGHEVEREESYCDGHMNLYITKYVTTFDAIYTADESGVSAYGSVGTGTFDATLGGVSAKYEAGGVNPGMISSGAGDHGGKSYGTWQLSSKTGTLASFVNWLNTGSSSTPNKAHIYEMLSAHTIASDSFDTAWRSAANSYFSEFQELQAQYIYSTHVGPFIQNVYENKGVDLSRSKALTELAFSTGVQFGPGAWEVVGDINESMTDAQIIQTCYAYKRNNVDTLFRSSSEAIRNSLRNNRFVTEEMDLISLILDDVLPPDIGDDSESDVYWNDERRDQVELLYIQDWSELYDVYFSTSSGALSDPIDEELIEDIIDACKAEDPDLSQEREKVIRTALSLVNRVQYYWGGGHESDLQAGWNEKWGTPAPPSSSPTTTYTTWGLDCSGFIRWVFLTAYDMDVYPYTAQGIRDANLAIDSSEARPGDLANVPGTSGSSDVHIGMYLYTRSDGQKLFVHCGSSSGVSLTTEYQGGFELYHKPALFSPN